MIAQILENWAFLAVSMILSLLTQAAKGTVLTKERAQKIQWVFYTRRLLPLFPVALGGILSLLPLPSPEEIAGGAERALYFALSGVMSTWAFSVIRSLAEKQGIKLELPGDSVSPPPKDEADDDEQEEVITLNEKGKK